jgi:hypothetical protein
MFHKHIFLKEENHEYENDPPRVSETLGAPWCQCGSVADSQCVRPGG